MVTKLLSGVFLVVSYGYEKGDSGEINYLLSQGNTLLAISSEVRLSDTVYLPRPLEVTCDTVYRYNLEHVEPIHICTPRR